MASWIGIKGCDDILTAACAIRMGLYIGGVVALASGGPAEEGAGVSGEATVGLGDVPGGPKPTPNFKPSTNPAQLAAD